MTVKKLVIRPWTTFSNSLDGNDRLNSDL